VSYILLLGPYFGNFKHGAEVGIESALVELGHKVVVWDPRINKLKSSDVVNPFNGSYKLGGTYDFVLCPGAGLPKKVLESVFFKSLSCPKILWNSEPIRLQAYRDKVNNQKHLYDYTFTFDESEIPLYKELGIKAQFLPQAFNEDRYKPLRDQEIVGDLCFIGSVGGKWSHRINLIRRLQQYFNIRVGTVFDATVVNEIYNSHLLILNLSLYSPECGNPNKLKGFALQQRIFESIGAGRVCVTNSIPAGTNELFKDKKHVLFYDSNNLEAVIEYGLEDDNRTRMEEEILKIRNQHTYKARMKRMLELLCFEREWLQ
jgi:hypothetical protein